MVVNTRSTTGRRTAPTTSNITLARTAPAANSTNTEVATVVAKTGA